MYIIHIKQKDLTAFPKGYSEIKHKTLDSALEHLRFLTSYQPEQAYMYLTTPNQTLKFKRGLDF